jgi:hypothetical protein
MGPNTRLTMHFAFPRAREAARRAPISIVGILFWEIGFAGSVGGVLFAFSRARGGAERRRRILAEHWTGRRGFLFGEFFLI